MTNKCTHDIWMEKFQKMIFLNGLEIQIIISHNRNILTEATNLNNINNLIIWQQLMIFFRHSATLAQTRLNFR